MVNYLDSRRIMGTTAERSSIPSSATAGGWVELGRTTLGSAGDTIDVTGLPNKRYYMVLNNGISSGNTRAWTVLGNGSFDTGSNYSQRYNHSGNEYTNTSLSLGMGSSEVSITTQFFDVRYIANYATKEKLFINPQTVNQNTAGAGTAPLRYESVGKWANTSNSLDRIRLYNDITGDFASGSEVVVLGWDPSDTHTTNFWEELADVTLSSAGDDLSSGTITAKKYLWVQAWYKNDGASDINALVRFNGDTGTNYSSRYSANGGADVTRTNRTWIDIESGNQRAKFVNMFIINNQSNEKLVIFNQMDNGASGAGNAPNRWEGVGKWTNTSNQITEINLKQLDAGDYASGSFIKVWGSD